ncbi:DUF512 domain-containing protein [Candidatus Sumerlaeota bacterium]|nr:DUF512 domain-containing protein [Candidatus Sumerlaeota bacterium]
MARPPRGVRVTGVEPGSPAARIGIEPGSRLARIGGSPVRDEIDLVFLGSEGRLRVEWVDCEGVLREKTLRKGIDASLGVEIEPLKARRCRNRCIFCFVDQNPPGLRPALRFKDEDFRLSFTHGHYITLTGLRRTDLERIPAQRLSPLYVSVHSTNHALRCRMLGIAPETAPPLLDTMKRLARRRIEFHAQIVLCPGWNDGAELDRTLDDLESLGEGVLSVAVVPVGLTAHRSGLPRLRALTPAGARALIRQAVPRQDRLARDRGHRTVLLADEIFLLAGEPLPDYTDEEIDSQIENGVGMIARFWKGWARTARRAPESVSPPRRVAVLTGLLGARVLEPLAESLNTVAGVDVEVIPLDNSLFGTSATVSGLLSGADFERGVLQVQGSDLVLIPANALRSSDERFLDDLTLSELRARHPATPIEALDGGASAIAHRILLSGRVGRKARATR